MKIGIASVCSVSINHLGRLYQASHSQMSNPRFRWRVGLWPTHELNSVSRTWCSATRARDATKRAPPLRLETGSKSETFGLPVVSLFFPGSIAKGSSSKSGCQLHLPTSHANLSRVTSPANFSCQLVESYFTCQLLMPTCRELLHLLTSHANLSRVTSPANFSCQLVESYFTCLLLMSTFRLLSHSTKSTS